MHAASADTDTRTRRAPRDRAARSASRPLGMATRDTVRENGGFERGSKKKKVRHVGGERARSSTETKRETRQTETERLRVSRDRDGDRDRETKRSERSVGHISPLRRVSRCVSYAGSVARYSPVIGHLYLPSSPVIGQKFLFG